MFSLRLTFHLKVSRLNYSQMFFFLLFSFKSCRREVYTVGVEEPPEFFISNFFAVLLTSCTQQQKISMSSLIHKLLVLRRFLFGIILKLMSYCFKVIQDGNRTVKLNINGMISIPRCNYSI